MTDEIIQPEIKKTESELDALLGQQIRTAKIDDLLRYKLASTLFDEDKINMITDLKEEHLSGLAKLFVVNECYVKEHNTDETILDDLILYVKEIRISLNRLGRKELIDAFTKVGMFEEVPRQGMLNKIRGRM